MSRARPDPDVIHRLDDRYDGVLTRMALCGGWAALSQLEQQLGDAASAHALVHEVEGAHLGQRAPLRSGPGEGLTLRLSTAWVLAGREEFAVATRRTGIYAAVQRLAFHHRRGRPLYSPLWLAPTLLARPDDEATRLDALEEAILGLFRSPYLFFDFHPDGPAIAVVDVPFRPGDLTEGLTGLRTFVRNFGRTVPLWVLTDCEERRAERVAWFAETPRVPDGVRVDVIDLATRHIFEPSISPPAFEADLGAQGEPSAPDPLP